LLYANEIPDVMTSIIDTYVEQRSADEPFIETYRRLGVTPFKESAYKNNGKHSKGAAA
jgi:sulfite reductase (NADPH) hemoprotein beta-component